MSWIPRRISWSFLPKFKKRTHFLKASYFHFISSSSSSSAGKTHLPDTKFELSPHAVHSTLVNCPSDLVALSFFIWCAKRRGFFHSPQAFDHMVSVLTRLTHRYNTVEAIIRELERVGFAAKPKTFLVLLRIYWQGEMYSMVLEAFEEMKNFGFTPNVFALNVMMDVLFKIGRVELGTKVLKETPLRNFYSFNIAVCNLCRLNDLIGAKNVMRLMLREGYYPNVEAFEMLLNCLCNLGSLSGVSEVLALMITLGFSLSVKVWTMLIHQFCRLRHPNMAGCLLERMIKSGSSPTVVTYTSLVKGYIESQMIDSAFAILDSMELEGFAPDLVLCNVLIHSLSKIGRYDDALATFIGLSKWNLVPDSFTFSSLLSTLTSSGRFNLLPNLISGMVIEADLVVHNSFLSYFCKIGFPSRAVELYSYMIDKGIRPDNYSFVGLLRGLCGERRIEEAINVYRGIVMNYPDVDAHVHTVIIDGLIRAGECHKALSLFRRAIIERYPLDVVSYTVAIHGLIKCGRTAEAFTLFNQMTEVGLSPNTHTYNKMLSGFCVGRDIKMVQKLLQEIIVAGIQIDYRTFIQLTNFLLKSLSGASCMNHLTKLWNLGLLPDEVMHDLLIYGFPNSVKACDANHLCSRSYLKDDLFVEASSSDELPYVSASVG